MSIRVMHRGPTGDLIEVPSHVLGLDKRIKEGDPTCLWPGDPRMFLMFNPQKQKYQVWRACEDGVERIICSWLPNQMDSRLLRHLASIDSQTRDVLGNIDRHNESLTRQREANAAAATDEAADYIRYIARRSQLPGYELPWGFNLLSRKTGSPK